jgi:hypothetical protein
VVEQKNPFSALKESTVLLKKTWGERIMMNFSFSTISFLLMIPAIGLIALAVMSKSFVAIAFSIALVLAYFILLTLVQSALEAIFQTAIYFYARNNRVPPGFDQSVLQSAIAQR